MPKGSKAGVRKECDACSEQIPVACKTCPLCNHELIPERRDSEVNIGGDILATLSEENMSDMDGDKMEKRRSVGPKETNLTIMMLWTMTAREPKPSRVVGT